MCNVQCTFKVKNNGLSSDQNNLSSNSYVQEKQT